MRVVLCLVLLGSVVTAIDPLCALAQPASAAARAHLAKQYVDAGLAAQNSGDYDTALALYAKAYQLVPHPVLLFDQAQAHRLAGHIDKALALYARYLAKDPKGSQARIARELTAELEARQARLAGAGRPAEASHEPDAGSDRDDEEPSAGADEAKADSETRGSLLVSATSRRGVAVNGASVLVDGQPRGVVARGTLTVAGITEGRHTVAIEAGGYRRFEKTVKIPDGEAAQLAAVLVEKPARSAFWKWSLGASVAIAVGGEGLFAYSIDRAHREVSALSVTGAAGATVSYNDCGQSYEEILAKGQLTSFNFQAFNRACTWTRLGFASLWIGGAGVVAALVSLIVLTHDPGPSETATITARKKPGLALVPIVTAGGAGASLSLTW